MTLLPLVAGASSCATTRTCDGWNQFFPTDLEYKEALTTSTLRSAGCHNPPVESTLANTAVLDGVELPGDLSLEIGCNTAPAPLLREATTGREYLRLLDLSRKELVPIRVEYVEKQSRCGLVVRPSAPLNYETFYALYLMRGPATDDFQEPRSFRQLKWKAFRNNIESETDELYRDALSQASERWGTHPDSFRMIQAFTTRSFRSATIPSITGRNQYFARFAKKPAFLKSIVESDHPLANFMIEAHNYLTRAELKDGFVEQEESDPQTGIDELQSRRQIQLVRNIEALGRNTGLQAGFAEIEAACITMPEPDLCNFGENSFPGLHPRYIPFLYSENLPKFRQVVVFTLDAFVGDPAAEIKSWENRLASQSTGMIVFLGPVPGQESRIIDHIQKDLLQGALSLSALPINPDAELALFCHETVYCPMLGLYSRDVSRIISYRPWLNARPSMNASFPPEQYRLQQLNRAMFTAFQFQSFLPEIDRTLFALRKDSLFMIRSSNIDRWFQSEEK